MRHYRSLERQVTCCFRRSCAVSTCSEGAALVRRSWWNMRILGQRSCFRCTAGWPISRSDLWRRRLAQTSTTSAYHDDLSRQEASQWPASKVLRRPQPRERSAELAWNERDTASNQEVFQASAGSDTSATTCSDTISVITPTRGDYNRRPTMPCETAV